MELNDKNQLRLLRMRMDEALDKIATELGLQSLKAGNIKYDSSGLTASIGVKAVAKSKDGKTQEMIDFERYATLYSLDADMLGKEFAVRGERFKIVGLNLRRRKYPVLCQSLVTGKRFCYEAESVKRKFASKPNLRVLPEGGAS